MIINIIVALEAEAKYIINSLNIIEDDKKSEDNIIIYTKKINHNIIHVFLNEKFTDGYDKIGTVSAAILTYKAILKTNPDLILNIGTCGGIKRKNIKLFDIIIGDKFVIYHDRFFTNIRENYSIGKFNCENTLRDFDYISGIIASGNSINLSKESWNIIEKYDVSVIDMEAAAIAEIASERNISFTTIKVVSDIVSKDIDSEYIVTQFKINFRTAMKKLSTNLPLILNSLLKKEQKII